MWGIPKNNPQVNKARINDQRARERNEALRQDPAAYLPISIDRGDLPALLRLIRSLVPLLKGDHPERRG